MWLDEDVKVVQLEAARGAGPAEVPEEARARSSHVTNHVRRVGSATSVASGGGRGRRCVVGVTVHRAPTSRAHSTPTPGSRQRQPAPARIQRCRAFTFQPDSLSLTRHSASRPRGVGEHRARRGSRDPRRPERPAVDGDTIRKISGLPDSKNFIGCAVPQCASARRAGGRVVVYNASETLRNRINQIYNRRDEYFKLV